MLRRGAERAHDVAAPVYVRAAGAVGLLALIIVGGVTAAFQWHIKECRRVSLGAAAICFCAFLGLLVFYNKTLHRVSGLDFILRKLPMQKQAAARWMRCINMASDRGLRYGR